MKKLLLLFIVIFISSCATSKPQPQLTQAQIERNIVGKWHSSYKKVAKDGVQISVDQSVDFKKNHILTTNQYTYFRDKNGKLIGSFLIKERASWKIYGNKLATLFLSCKTIVLKQPKTAKLEFVSNIMKDACKYANSDLKAKTAAYTEVKNINSKFILLKGIKFVKIK